MIHDGPRRNPEPRRETGVRSREGSRHVRDVGRPTGLRASRPEACRSGASAIAAEKSMNYEGGVMDG